MNLTDPFLKPIEIKDPNNTTQKQLTDLDHGLYPSMFDEACLKRVPIIFTICPELKVNGGENGLVVLMIDLFSKNLLEN